MMKSRQFPAFAGMISTLVILLLCKTVNGLYRPSDLGICLACGFATYGVFALFQWIDEL
jgi:hypothetical protein